LNLDCLKASSVSTLVSFLETLLNWSVEIVTICDARRGFGKGFSEGGGPVVDKAKRVGPFVVMVMKPLRHQ
jgi:hypothetical protein